MKPSLPNLWDDAPAPRPKPGPLRIGASGWSYPVSSGAGTWVGAFYPLTRVDELEFYSRYFDTVEINSTFYRPCAPKTAESWVRRTPDDFEFTVKVSRRFTHERDWTDAEMETFRDGLKPLAESGKLGCWLFQFPASFHRSAESEDYLRILLARFGGESVCVELRHSSWNASESFLAACDAAPAFIDEPKFADSIDQDMPASGRLLYVRFHGRRASSWWRHEHRDDRYDYFYSAEELAPYAVRLKKVTENPAVKRAYVFFNNHPGAKAIANAAMLRVQLGLPPSEPLPERLLERFPQLRGYNPRPE